uniref:HMG box domain-containing protein n=1 Tax=Fusarium oxysporum (strain Fo5176) TaxID=660025 RepID=A0A0D2XCR2_FUSOF
MSPDLESIFAELGLSQYLGAFVEQGFDEWDIILDIQESDLDALGVKLGHRRKLQRRIANARGISPSVSLVTSVRPTSEDAKSDSVQPEPTRTELPPEGQGVAKRKYRRHPKPDENAPERPPSAYVLFSNKIAKLVGENWQNLNASEKEAYESQANADKEKYHRDLMEYKKTADYRKYMQYLHEFKEKQAKRTQADVSKRTKLDPVRLRHSSSSSSTMTPGGNTSSGSGSERLQGSEPPPCRRERLNSIASIAESQHSSTTPTLLSQANSNDETMSSPQAAHFDAGSPREPHYQAPKRQQSWREGGPGVEVSHQHLPSLSNMLEDGRKGMQVPSGSEGNPYSSGFVAANHPRSVPEVPNVLPSAPPKPPLLRHEPSSSSSIGSVSPAAGFARSPGEGPLPIHALLSHHQTLPTPVVAANAAMFERGSPVSGLGTGTTTPSPTDPVPLVRPYFGHGVVPRGYGT